jgi:hypothetical protein
MKPEGMAWESALMIYMGKVGRVRNYYVDIPQWLLEQIGDLEKSARYHTTYHVAGANDIALQMLRDFAVVCRKASNQTG